MFLLSFAIDFATLTDWQPLAARAGAAHSAVATTEKGALHKRLYNELENSIA